MCKAGSKEMFKVYCRPITNGTNSVLNSIVLQCGIKVVGCLPWPQTASVDVEVLHISTSSKAETSCVVVYLV